MPSVFISYSHDPADPTHAKNVARLAASLLEGGLEVFFDQNRGDEEEKVPWEIWMEDKILKAEHVLMVCTELYLKKVRQQVTDVEGQGVCWEAGIIYTLLYRVKRNTTKFLPVVFSAEHKNFIPLPLQGKQWFVVDTQSGYERLYAFLTGQHRARFPKQSASLQTVDQETIEPLFALPGKASLPAKTDSILAPDKPILVANAQLTLKPDIPPAPRKDIRGLDWYDECDAGQFIGRNDDADRILAMLLSHPIIRLVGPSGIGKSSLIRAGLLPKIREFNWRACMIRPFEDPDRRVPPQLAAQLLTSPGTFTTPLDPAKFRADVAPLLSSNGIKRLVLFLDQFEDIVSPVATPAAVDVMREFLWELWQQREAEPRLRAVVVYRTDADGRLGRLWQEVSGRPEGLPYLALEGLSCSVAGDIISQTAREHGWRMETSVPEIARQLALESQKLDCSDEVFPIYLQIFLKRAEQSGKGYITAEFITSLGGVSGLIGKYLEQTLETLKARGEEWQQCGAVLESLSRSTGGKAAQSLNDLVRETGMSRAVLAKMLPVLINERLVRPVGHETYEIQHDRLAAAVIESMIDSDRDAKVAREFLNAKVRLAARVPAFEQRMVLLAPDELVYLYRYRRKIYPTEQELWLVLASMLHNIEMEERKESPGAYWFAESSSQDFLHRFIQIEHWADEERNFSPSRGWAETFPLSDLESQFGALAADPVPSIRAICAQWIGRTKRGEDLPLLRKLIKDQDADVRFEALKAVKALASFSRAEALPLLHELADSTYPDVRFEAVKALASFSRAEALPLLHELADSTYPDVRFEAVKALASFSRAEDLPLLRELAKSTYPELRLEALKALASFSEAEALPLLRELANEGNMNVRLKALKTLASFSEAEALPLLRELAKSTYPEVAVRLEALKALASFSKKEALPLLSELAKDEDARVRREAAKTLASFSWAEDLPLLRELANMRVFTEEVCLEASKALASFSKKEALPLLSELAKQHGGFEVRREAVKALASFSKKENLRLLRELANDEHLYVRFEAVKALASFSRTEDLPLLRKLAKSESLNDRLDTVKALANFSRAEVLPMLRELANDKHLYVRLEAVKALASFSRAEDLPLLRELALARNDEGDGDAVFRDAVATAAVRGLASLCSREELEAFLNRHDKQLCAGALAALDELLYMPEWMKAKYRLQKRDLLEL